MWLLLRITKIIPVVLWALVWVAGVVGLWWLIPVVPRERWELAPSESYVGLLSDGMTLLTVSRQNVSNANSPGSSVYLRKVDSGQLRSNPIHFERGKVAGLLCSESQDLLKVFYAKPPRLSLNDATTGREITSFPAPDAADDAVDFKGLPNPKSCVLARDGQTIAFVSRKKPGYVEWYDVPSGRLLHRLSDLSGHVRFAPDSRRLLVATGPSLIIFDVLTGREVGRLETSTWGLDSPVFLPDGKHILDEYCNVWDIATRTRRFNVPLNWVSEVAFTPDGKDVVARDESLTAIEPDCWLAYYDVDTGQEQIDRRVPLDFDRKLLPGPNLIPCGRWLLARGVGRVQRFKALADWIAKLSGIKVPSQDRLTNAYILVEAQTGRVVTRGEGIAETCTPDGRHVLARNAEGVEQIWKVPSPNAIGWLVLAGISWSIALVLIAWYCRTSKNGIQGRWRFPDPRLLSPARGE